MSDPLRGRWLAWEKLTYPAADSPPGSLVGTVHGVDLALLDGDVAGFFYSALEIGRLSEQDRESIASYVDDLRLVVPDLTDSGQDYFGVALAILEEMSVRFPPASQGT